MLSGPARIAIRGLADALEHIFFSICATYLLEKLKHSEKRIPCRSCAPESVDRRMSVGGGDLL